MPRNRNSPAQTPVRRTSLLEINRQTLRAPREPPSEADELADQMAAMRIIASSGKDTKYMSIRGPMEPPKPSPLSAPASGKKDARSMIVGEIVSTEEKYVNDLEILVRLYVHPMTEERGKKKKTMIPKEQSRILFRNVEAIANLNRVLLAELQAQASLPVEEQRIGSAFITLSKCLLLYSDYCNNQEQADELYTKLKGNSDTFNNLMKENMAKPESQRLDLNSFLLKPVQRVCKYPLLLRELLSKTPESHPDYDDLRLALEGVQESCLKLNERKRDMEKMSHFLTIKARTGKNFIESGRTFVSDGHVQIVTEKAGRRTKKGPPKFRLRNGRYVLFSDMIVFICEGKVLAQILLATSNVVDPEIPDYPLALMIEARAARLILLPTTPLQKDQLMEQITTQITSIDARTRSMEARRASPAKRDSGRARQQDTSVAYDCEMNGVQKTIKLPFECPELEDFRMTLKRAYDLPNDSFTVKFVTPAGAVVVTTNQEYQSNLANLKRIILVPGQ